MKPQDNEPMDTPEDVMDQLMECFSQFMEIATRHDVTFVLGVASYDMIDRKEQRRFLYGGRDSSVRGVLSMLNETVETEVNDDNTLYYSIDDGDDDGDVRSIR